MSRPEDQGRWAQLSIPDPAPSAPDAGPDAPLDALGLAPLPLPARRDTLEAERAASACAACGWYARNPGPCPICGEPVPAHLPREEA